MQTRYKRGFAAGAAVFAVLVAAPATGLGPGSSAQPPPGTVDPSPGPVAPVPAQPAANAHGVKVTHVAAVPKQPANRHPVDAGRPVSILRHSKHDAGVKNLPVQKDHGTKNLPAENEGD